MVWQTQKYSGTPGGTQGNYTGCQRWNLGWLCERQAPYMLYYFSSLTISILVRFLTVRETHYFRVLCYGDPGKLIEELCVFLNISIKGNVV